MTVLPFVSVILIVSSVLCLILNSWITIWVMLEMNTLAFCCLTKTSTSNKKTMTEMSMKYFVIQSISSSLLIFSSMFTAASTKILSITVWVGVTALAIKMGASPFHQWFVGMTKSMVWKNSTILMTWQKLAPVFLMVYQLKFMALPFILISMGVGSLSQINNTSVMEIMAFSSVFNLSWMLAAIVLSSTLLMVFSIFYWISVVSMMTALNKTKMTNINSMAMDSTKKFVFLLVIINLAGIPPLAGFVAKWIVFKEMLKFNMTALVTLFLVTSSLNLYIYLRMSNLIVSNNSDISQKKAKQASKSLMSNLAMTIVSPLVICVMLGNAWSKDYFDSMEWYTPNTTKPMPPKSIVRNTRSYDG